MIFASYAYRVVSNFVFLGLVYFTLNLLEKYKQRATVAILVLVYAAMHAFSGLRSFYFFQRIERLEVRRGGSPRRPARGQMLSPRAGRSSPMSPCSGMPARSNPISISSS
ncbi:hypothetical protein [Bradyrhizobium brasilense]|uniref:hypothetical protein n=1 Tax=Bradyrhizobium brasilense TaxID=1419277 RepID=UPI003B9690EB